MQEFSLYQLNEEHSGFFMNSGPDADTLIEAAKRLSKQYPNTEYAVKCANCTIWTSMAKFRLLRREGDLLILILSGSKSEPLIEMGQYATDLHPGWMLEVQDEKSNPIWINKESADR